MIANRLDSFINPYEDNVI